MIPYKRGDVILIPFPFTDLSAAKRRPALVISSGNFHQSGKDLVVCAITSQSPTLVGAFDYLLSESDLASAGLPKLSKIRCGKMATLDSRIVRRKIGELPSSTVSEIIHLVHQIV